VAVWVSSRGRDGKVEAAAPKSAAFWAYQNKADNNRSIVPLSLIYLNSLNPIIFSPKE
jgi:hypothetical protein